MQEQSILPVKKSSASIEFDAEATRKSVNEALTKYDYVVTLENIQDAKKDAADLNKWATGTKKATKTLLDEITAQPKAVYDDVLSIVQDIANKQQKIRDQITKFEDEKKQEIRTQLSARLNEVWDKHGVDPEYRKAGIDDLVKLGSVTKKTGALTAGAVSDIENRVALDKAMQNDIEKRLLQLENKSYRAGLESPLRRAHIESFLFADSDEYETQLDAVIAAELERQQEIHASAERKAKQERAQEQEDAERRVQTERSSNVADPDPEPVPETDSEPPAAKLKNYSATQGNDVVPQYFDAATDDEAILAAVKAFPNGKTFLFLPDGLVATIDIERS